MTIPFVQAKHFKAANRLAIDLIVIHTMEYPERAISAEWCAGFFANPMRKRADGTLEPVVASCHYSIDSDSIMQSVREEDVAYHAGSANGFSIGIEHAGYAGQTPEQWADSYSIAMLERSAEFVAGLCAKYGIPARRITAEDLKRGERRGICGHVDVTNAYQGGKGHWDPGKHFPWDWYIERVASHLAPAADVDAGPVPSSKPDALPLVIDPALASIVGDDDMVSVELEGQRWLVSPVYVAPIGIGQAFDLARRLGYELPTPALVDAIWRAADLKIPPHVTIQRYGVEHDGTVRTMDGASTHARVKAQAETFAATHGVLGRDFYLVGGGFKDVVQKDGKIGIYGMHADEDAAKVLAAKPWGLITSASETRGDGTVVQRPYFRHSALWRDYSQGLRLAKRAP